MSWSESVVLRQVKARKALVSLVIVAAFVATSAAAAVAVSGESAIIESASPEVTILDVSHDPDEALVEELVTWSVLVSVEAPNKLGKGLLFTWDWDDGTYTVNRLKSLTSEDTAVDVQTHAWSAPGTYDVVISVYDGFGPQQNKFHNVSAVTEFVVKLEEPNTPPVARFSVCPAEGTLDTVFMYNANSSYDLEDPLESLQMRWDWEADGSWDTAYSNDSSAEHVFSSVGVYLSILEVMDSGGLMAYAWGNVTVLDPVVLTPHDPIHIVGDVDFAATAAEESWPGQGTEQDPYVIESLDITNHSESPAIWIESTTVSFVIRDCALSANGSAVHLLDVVGGFIEDNVFTNSPLYSIYCQGCTFIWIGGNIIHGGSHCIGVIESELIYVGDNTVYDSGWWSLWIASSRHVDLRGNDFYGSGIEISGSQVSHWNTHDIDESNMVNGAPVCYFKDRQWGVAPPYAGQIILANCTGMTISTNLTGSILLGFSSCNMILQSSVMSVHYGITLSFSPMNYIMSTSVADCYYGIYMRNSPDCIINCTTVSGCVYGIWAQQSDGTKLYLNDVTGSEWCGIFLYYSSYCDVRWNEVAGSQHIGIKLVEACSNYIASNDFVSNALQADEAYESTGNVWDGGYPTGGNYWSDYCGVDKYSGVDQTEPGSDGIGDTPYVLMSGSQDNYPLMEPFGPAPENTAPTANFTISAEVWAAGEVFWFDASSSCDLEDDLSELQVRWDLDGDGVWDTGWSYAKTTAYVFPEPGLHMVALEVMDTGGLTDVSSVELYVPPGEEPPEDTLWLPFATTDIVFDPVRPYAYVSEKYAMKVHFVDLTDGSVDRTFEFGYMTESLAMTPDGSRLFVALLTKEHDPYWFDGHVGYIASIDLETWENDREFMIDEDPFDLLATSNGHLVVSPGSGQWDTIKTYDATDGTNLGSAFIRHMSRLSMHPSEGIVYAADTDLWPSDITRFDLYNSGRIVLVDDSPYHGEYEMGGNVWVNPLGDSLVVGGGHVLTAGMPKSEDMYYITTLTAALITDVEFDLNNGTVLTLQGAQLVWYDIESYEFLGATVLDSEMEFLGLNGMGTYCVDVQTNSTTIYIL